MTKSLGFLVPVGGGDKIPLDKTVMTIGRRSSCDICLDFHNVSGMHCELDFRNGVWSIRDLGSTNGIKVNGNRVLARSLPVGSEISIAGHKFIVDYTPPQGNRLDDMAEETEDVFGQSLLERAGLAKPRENRS